MAQLLWLAWLLPAFPLLAFVLIIFVTRGRNELSTAVAIGGIGLTLVTSVVLFISFAVQPGTYVGEALYWYTLGREQTTTAIYIDGISAILMLVVPLVCLMIFIYSIGYMRGDSRYHVFFAYISLFSAGMMGLIVFDNLLALFLCWEIMGTCSYLLIGFWFEKETAYMAGLKAFIVTKVGDLFLVLGVVLLSAQAGSLHYTDLLSPESLAFLAATPFAGHVSIATMAGVLILLGAMGKSAQFPLHVWLPDAMMGPTPASSLIHAATMVSAGVYLLIRMSPLLAIGNVLPLVAGIGAFTALFAAVIALTQNDIKRVLAFSTISQLGYMVTSVGIGAPDAALFHLVTHAVFKALLFMSAGSVIHGMEHGHHHSLTPAGTADDFDPNELFGMGGLAKRMPVTAVGFTAGAMALSGFPLISAGFWSKDEIIASAWSSMPMVFWVLVITAGLTALYTGREWILVFLGKPRSDAAEHARESAKSMIWPLLILGLLAVVLGWAGIPDHFPVIGGVLPNFVQLLLHSGAGEYLHESAVIAESEASLVPLLLSVLMSLGGLALAWRLYGRGRENTGDAIQRHASRLRLAGLYRFVQDRFRIDALYRRVFIVSCLGESEWCNAVDTKIIDGVVTACRQIVVGVAGASTWTDENVIDRSINLVGSKGASQGADWFDTRVVSGLADLPATIVRAISAMFHLADHTFLDGFVSSVASLTQRAGRFARDRQSGVLTDYLWNAFVMVLILIAGILFLQR